MEASALPASVGLGRTRITIGASLLRIRSDEQLVTFFRDGNDEAFRVIHDRYRTRLYAYTRQMLAGTSQDPEDAVQEIFMRAYHGLRASKGPLALRAWLYRIAHNRCIDDLRRPRPIAVEEIDALAPNVQDPVTKVEQRDALRRLISDVQRLPEQQRSALLMRELSGMPYAEVSGALGVSVPAVKSLLVRARVSLAQASEARDTACALIREDMILAHDRGVRTSGLARRHMRDCPDCREFRSEVRGVTRNLAALAPTLGPLGVIANLLGWGGSAGGGAAAGGGAVAGTGAGASVAVAGGAIGTGTAASTGLIATGAGHVVTLLAAAVVTAGGAVELQKTLSAPAHRAHHHAVASALRNTPDTGAPVTRASNPSGAPSLAANTASATAETVGGHSIGSLSGAAAIQGPHANSGQLPITETLDPDHLLYATPPFGTVGATTPGSTATPGTGLPGGAGATAGTTPGASGAATTPGTGTTATTGTTGTIGASSQTGSTGTASTSATTGTAGPGATGTSGPASAGSGSATGAPASNSTAMSSGQSTTTAAGTTGSAASSSTAASTSATPGGAGAVAANGASSTGTSNGTTTGTGTTGATSMTGTSQNAGQPPYPTTKRHHHHRILVGRLL